MLQSVSKQEATEGLERFARCDCYSHALCVNVDKEDNQVYVSQWSYGRGDQKLNWKEQLRYMWQILTKRQPYEDEIVLNFKAAHDLGEFLIKHCEEGKCKEAR